jgi:hypothetical protein
MTLHIHLVLAYMDYIKILEHKILVGVWVQCWAIWLNRNDIVFDKSKVKSNVDGENDMTLHLENTVNVARNKRK